MYYQIRSCSCFTKLFIFYQAIHILEAQKAFVFKHCKVLLFLFYIFFCIFLCYLSIIFVYLYWQKNHCIHTLIIKYCLFYSNYKYNYKNLQICTLALIWKITAILKYKGIRKRNSQRFTELSSPRRVPKLTEEWRSSCLRNVEDFLNVFHRFTLTSPLAENPH